MRGPIYIINPELSPGSSRLAAFRLIVGGLQVPSVFMNLFFIAFGFKDPDYDTLWQFAQGIEVVFLIEIIVHFFTAFRDPETFKIVTNMKQIAQNYVTNGSFALDFIAFFPYQLLFNEEGNADDPDKQVMRNIFLLKMIRIVRLGGEIIPEKHVTEMINHISVPPSRDDKIAQDRLIA